MTEMTGRQKYWSKTKNGFQSKGPIFGSKKPSERTSNSKRFICRLKQRRIRRLLLRTDIMAVHTIWQAISGCFTTRAITCFRLMTEPRAKAEAGLLPLGGRIGWTIADGSSKSKKNGNDSRIGLFGVSMGGATVMMVSGEKLPKQVKAIVEDCGYSSVYDELSTQLTDQFGLPKEPILSTAALFASPFIGYNFTKEGSSVAQLRKNKRPIFLIHGDSDDFVPTSMLQKNYDAVRSTKEKWVVKNTRHANAYYTHPKEYARKVGKFFGKYLD